MTNRKRWLGLALLSILIGIALQLGCAGDTGSRRFPFEALIGGAQSKTGEVFTFTNQTGWTVTLARATVTLGPVYLNVVAPLGDSTETSWLPFVRTAWAHGEGHLSAGRIVGEVLSQVTFDALSDELVAFPVKGTLTEEPVRTAEIWFYPEPGVSTDTVKIATAALEVAGEAAREGSTVRFHGRVIFNDAWLSDQTTGTRGAQSITEIRKVRGIAASFIPTEGGRLEIRFDVTRLFRGADFSNLKNNPIDEDGTIELVQSKSGKVTTDQVMTNLYQGLRESNGTYAVIWVGP